MADHAKTGFCQECWNEAFSRAQCTSDKSQAEHYADILREYAKEHPVTASHVPPPPPGRPETMNEECPHVALVGTVDKRWFCTACEVEFVPSPAPDRVTMEELADDCRRLLTETERLTAALEAVKAENAKLREKYETANDSRIEMMKRGDYLRGKLDECEAQLAEAQKDSARLTLLADWLSDLPDGYCISIWRERASATWASYAGADPDDSVVSLVAGDPKKGKEERYDGDPSSIWRSFVSAIDRAMTPDAARSGRKEAE